MCVLLASCGQHFGNELWCVVTAQTVCVVPQVSGTWLSSNIAVYQKGEESFEKVINFFFNLIKLIFMIDIRCSCITAMIFWFFFSLQKFINQS